ncbi:hypothetical protein [Amycolatopsis cihanbeyliensis]|uniref:Lipoprotein n=1 Tax=Amycolatopsis cihanbeyliensis TaxID=1128664 RepID=A0A542DHR0_AMYCI|nr:hypothetical protein [Amycolatopsis cihanbeyliensis]TQJ02621.1 hypothetical protein FB471_2355 [Amycolatopsis cihanbeyliensis]
MRRGTRRIIGALAVGLALTLGACGSDEPERTEVVAKIKSMGGFADAPEATVGCIADWLMGHAAAEDLAAFVAGERDDQSLEWLTRDERSQQAVLDCLKGATEAR